MYLERVKNLLVILLVVSTIVSWSAASTRNVYGYVFGIGSTNAAIKEIRIRDNATGFVHWADGWKWSPLAPGGLRWWKNGLPKDRDFTVTVTAAFTYNGSRSVTFRLVGGWGDYKAPNINF